MTPPAEDAVPADDPSAAEANVRADRYAFVFAEHGCSACGMPIPVVALYLPAGFETLAPTLDGGCDAWESSRFDALLFDVTWISAAVLTRLHEAAPWWPSTVTADSRGGWCNRCLACGEDIADVELFTEPGAAFVPGGPVDRHALRIVPVEAGLLGAAGGFALDPWSGCAVRELDGASPDPSFHG